MNVEDKIKVYPNPVRDQLYVESETDIPISVQLISAIGTPCHIALVNNKIDFSLIPEGMHFLSIHAINEYFTKPIVVVK